MKPLARSRRSATPAEIRPTPRQLRDRPGKRPSITLAVAYTTTTNACATRTKAGKGTTWSCPKSNILLIGPTGSGKTLLRSTRTLAPPTGRALRDGRRHHADREPATWAGTWAIVKLLQLQLTLDAPSAASRLSADRQDQPQVRQPQHHARDVSGEGVQRAAPELIRSTMASVAAPGAGANTRTRTSCRSTRLTSCSSAAARLKRTGEGDRKPYRGVGHRLQRGGKQSGAALTEVFRDIEPRTSHQDSA